jgi:hypothetical protein
VCAAGRTAATGSPPSASGPGRTTSPRTSSKPCLLQVCKTLFPASRGGSSFRHAWRWQAGRQSAGRAVDSMQQRLTAVVAG